jgi:hypothetical protein
VLEGVLSSSMYLDLAMFIFALIKPYQIPNSPKRKWIITVTLFPRGEIVWKSHRRTHIERRKARRKNKNPSRRILFMLGRLSFGSHR